MLIKNNSIKSSLPSSLCLYFLPELTSYTSNHRFLLREKIIPQLLRLEQTVDKKQILDLTQRPTTAQKNISLSHSQTGSGFAIIDKNFLIGFDVESKSRLNTNLIKRISSSLEITKCPDERFLFCAKEATWKALNELYKIPTLSHIETTHWQQLKSQWYQYQAAYNGKLMDGHGYIYEYSGTYLSFFHTSSTFI